ncbi:hypothetical protein [Microbacterium sp. W4I20]|uniref:hypothetical protein n=1 Tax=Microbacterium sp. W4I20 TaxID=3042262 RepID=UPI002780DC65|nr:hypothetical protein [Microbacterium sp. W4I20]MDQ0726797.1 hypothetical protein [Microbacterium sp. W4I20]
MDWSPILVAVCASIGTLVGSYFLFRGKKVDKQIKEVEVEASAEDAFLKGQAAFQKYVDDVVDRQVSAAVADFQRRLTEMETRLAAVSLESHEMNDAVRSRETQLWLWNIHGRAGVMPELPMPIMTKLGIIHLAATQAATDPEDTQGEAS